MARHHIERIKQARIASRTVFPDPRRWAPDMLFRP